ncbi:hypothetical protein [Allosphingosinicella vermicomposti]|uniref:hypothetical protein n=1 Tax=Allosphingosinicella vermicomposti TaxID=614671 RepID=UPI00131A5262|nr:hypothetical protein [Allosphingosinicella vermicomposti]
MPLVFSYYRSQAPMLWVFLVLASIELFAVHLLVSLWSAKAAWILSGLSLLTIAWILHLIRSLRLRPVEAGPDAVLLRLGNLSEVRLMPSNVADIRTNWPGTALKEEGVLNLSLLAYPNVLISLVEPTRSKRGRLISAIAHRLDDPAGFVEAVNRFRPAPAAAKAG